MYSIITNLNYSNNSFLIFKNKENTQKSSDNARFILPSPKKPRLTEITEYNFNVIELDELESSIENASEQDNGQSMYINNLILMNLNKI